MTIRLSRFPLVGTLLLAATCGLVAVSAQAQSAARQTPASEERREQEQRMTDIFKALGVRPGAAVADIGAGQGFYTLRLARAVGESGRVFAVDVDRRTLAGLRDRAASEGLANVTTIEGKTDNPGLDANTLDAALIVNVYHEMTEYAAMLAHIRAALKPDGRLVILEPISASRRQATRDEQTRRHEIAPALVQEDARAAGFSIVGLEDPFDLYRNTYWMLVLKPGPVGVTEPEHDHEAEAGEARSAARIGLDEFIRLQREGQVIVLDVRDATLFAEGRIPGARFAPLSAWRDVAAELKGSTAPIVAYCSCPNEETSGRAVAYLAKQGIANARALVGGFDGWVKEGRPVVTGK